MKKVHFFSPAIYLTVIIAQFCISCNDSKNDAEKYKGEVGLANFDTTVNPQQQRIKRIPDLKALILSLVMVCIGRIVLKHLFGK